MSSTLHHRSSPTTATAARSGSSVTSDQQQQKHQQQHPQYNLSTTSSASLHPASSSTSSFALKPTTSSSGLSSASEVDIPDIPAAQSSTHLPPKSFDILRALTCCFHCRKTNIVGSSAVRSRPPRGPIENVRVHIRRNDHGRTVVKTSLVMKPGTMGRRLFSQEDVDEYEYEDDVFDQNDGRRPMGSLGDKRGVPPPLLVDSSSQSPFLGSEEEPSTKIMDDKTNDSMSITSIARSVADDFEAEMETIMKMFAEALKGLPEPMLTRYQFKGLLGYGGNGFVADCVDNETGMEIAVKFIPKSRISHDSLVHSNEFGCAVPLEAQILRSIQHPNIISLVFFHECEKFVYIGMEKAKKLTWRLSDDHPTMVTVDMTTGRIIDDIDYDSALPQPMEPGPPTPSATITRSFREVHGGGGHHRSQSVGGLSILSTSLSSASILRNPSIRSQQISSHTHLGSLHRHVLTAVSPATPLPDSSVIPWQTSLSRRRQRSSVTHAGVPSLGSPMETPSPFSLISSEGLTTVAMEAATLERWKMQSATISRGGEDGRVRVTSSPSHAELVDVSVEESLEVKATSLQDGRSQTLKMSHPLEDRHSKDHYSRASHTSRSVPGETTTSLILTRPRHSHPGDLYDFVTMYGITPVAVQRHIFRQLVSAYGSIRMHGFVYLDFRGENVMIDDDLTVKMVDFGMAQREMEEEGEELFLQYGTREASAPEVLRGEGYRGPEADVWAMGLILFMLATGGEDAFGSEEEALRGEVELPEYMDEDCRDLVRRMLEVDKGKRATLDEIREHRFVAMVEV